MDRAQTFDSVWMRMVNCICSQKETVECASFLAVADWSVVLRTWRFKGICICGEEAGVITENAWPTGIAETVKQADSRGARGQNRHTCEVRKSLTKPWCDFRELWSPATEMRSERRIVASICQRH